MGTSITPHDQTKRLLRLATSLGKDVLIPLSLHGSEAMSEGFLYQVTAFSEDRHDLVPKDLIGKPVTCVLMQEDSSKRYLHGYVSGLQALGRSYGGQRSRYQLSIVSWLWFLGRRTDCRIFQNKSIPDVLKAIFAVMGDVAKTDFSKITGQHPQHRYLVQYNETDLNFISRLMRREGIAYYFTHDNGSHTVHFIDNGNDVPPLEPQELKLQSGTPAHDHITSWTHAGHFVTGKYTRRAYSYQEPASPLTVSSLAPSPMQDVPRVPEMESYSYTEWYNSTADGRSDAERRMAQGVERHRSVSGSATYRNLKVGHHFKVTPVPDGEWPDRGLPFTFSRVDLSVDDIGGTVACQANFEAVPKGELVYPDGAQPVIAGLQTAVVTGPDKGSKNEVYKDHATDKLGRIKVLFHWDREGKLNADNTCWLRVMQPFAGNGFGAYFLPRVGQEVVVAFENGNPDRPFVVGALYHPENTPPYAGEPTQSGIKTRTVEGGKSNFNELRFDDKKGKEEVFVQAERDLNLNVKHDLGADIHNNETRKIGNELTITAKNKIHLQVGGNTITIDRSSIKITGGLVDVDGNPVQIN